MSLRTYVSRLVPVVFLPSERSPSRRPPVAPDYIRLRWGKTSDFNYTATARPSSDDDPEVRVEGDEEVKISGDEVHREYAEITVTDPGNTGTPIKVEALKSVTFFIGSRDLYRPVKSGNLTMYFLEQTVDEYLKITFPQFEDEGERGEEAKAEGTDPQGAQPVAPGYSPPRVTEYRVPVDAASGGE